MSKQATHTNTQEVHYNKSEIRNSAEAPCFDWRGSANDIRRSKLDKIEKEHELTFGRCRDSTEYYPIHDEAKSGDEHGHYSVGVVKSDSGKYQVIVWRDSFEEYKSGVSPNPHTIGTAFKNALNFVQDMLEKRAEVRSRAEQLENIDGVKSVQINIRDFTADVSVVIDDIDTIKNLGDNKNLYIENVVQTEYVSGSVEDILNKLEREENTRIEVNGRVEI